MVIKDLNKWKDIFFMNKFSFMNKVNIVRMTIFPNLI